MPPAGANSSHSAAHRIRAEAAVRELRRQGKVWLVDLARDLGARKDTLSETVDFLVAGGVVEKGYATRDGKRQTTLRLRPDIGILAGVEISGDVATAAVTRFDFSDPLTEHVAVRLDNPHGALREIANLVERLIGRWRRQHQETPGHLVGVGLCLPGPIRREQNHDSDKRAAEWNRYPEADTILPGWDEHDPGAALARLLVQPKRELHTPRVDTRRFVWVENDASAGALGVHSYLRINPSAYEGPAPQDLLYVRVTWGIGAGIINKGHLVTGAHGFAAELGHITVDPAGSLCYVCGRRGCLETVASDRAIEQQLRAAFSSAGKGAHDRQLSVMLEEAHPAVDRALRDAGSHIATALAPICTMLDPEWIVIGGLQPETISPYDDRSQFIRGFQDSLRQHLPPQFNRSAVEARRLRESRNERPPKTEPADGHAEEGIAVRAWSDIAPKHPLGPELLGSLALVIDHLGDGYLLDPVDTWISSDRTGMVSFA